MTVEFIKKSINEAQRAEENNKVKTIVENTLKEIELKGDNYVRELSKKFDKYSPSSFRLSEDEISKLVDEVSDNDKEDIRFAQKQVRSFAEAQLKSLSEIEVETQPGVILGHKYTCSISWLLCSCRKISNGGISSYVCSHCFSCWSS